MEATSGLIIAFVVVVWAAYFIPLALRRYDDASKNESVESTGSLSRVILWPRAGRSAVDESESDHGPDPAVPPVVRQPVVRQSASARNVDRPATRLAARRRRRTLLTLVALTVIVGALAFASVIAMPFVAIPAALIVAWLVACRIQVRGELGIARTKKPRTSKVVGSLASKVKRSATAKPKAKVKAKSKLVGAAAADEEETIIVSGQFEDVDPGRPHVMEVVALEADALDDKIVIAVPSVSASGEALWDPLPVTLPTYVTKPRAGRTVRTIDFSQPSTWTSGHIEGEDTELPSRADEQGEERRAVGH